MFCWRSAVSKREQAHMSIMDQIYWCSCWQHPFIDLQSDNLWMTWTESNNTEFGLPLYSISTVDKIRQLLSSFCVSRQEDSSIYYHSSVWVTWGELHKSIFLSLLFIQFEKESWMTDLDQIQEYKNTHFEDIPHFIKVKITNKHHKL